MNDDSGLHDLRAIERLHAMEQRLSRIERQTGDLVAAMPRGRFPFLSRIIRPRLWTYRQYPTRRLKLDPAYVLETPPDNPPKIAIVTPSLNHAAFIRATIDSVLAQNYPNLSYVLQDACSGDSTPDILRSYGDRISWHSERDSGQANGINRGFQRLDGDIMAYLNSDDMLLPGTLACVARAFQDNPDIDVIYGHRIYVDSHGLEIGRCILPPHDPETLKWADFIPQETLFWRRRVWDAVGPFDESFEFALDWDFVLRAQAAGFRFKRLPRFLACFRVHDEQKTTSLMHIGEKEMLRLRIQYLGEMPGIQEIRQGITGYLLRQRFCETMYRLGIFRY